MGKQNRLADGLVIRQQYRQAIDAHAEAVAHRAQLVFIQRMRIARLHILDAIHLDEALFLIERIVQF